MTDLNDTQLNAAMVTRSGFITINDVTTIQRYIAEIITAFLIENK